MGCQASSEDVEALAGGSIVLPGEPYGAPTDGPGGDLQKVVPPTEPSKGRPSPPYKVAADQAGASVIVKPGEVEGTLSEGNILPFPLPEGWRVVCRLSQNDARSRWGTRPRPASANSTPAGPSSGTNYEADLIAPELTQPLRLPLLLLPQWIEPKVGSQFVGRYEVRKELPVKSTPQPGMKKGRRLEAFDKQDNVEVAVQVCELATEVDVKSFTERLQMEALDRDNVLFLRLRNIALALPGRLALIEDLPRRTLWQEFGSGAKVPGFGAKLGNVANSVLSGLCRLHAHGWAHCGISPETVCLAADGNWKLTSLELACKVKSLSPATFEEIGTVVEAPEVLLGRPLSEKVDVWQLAATLCEALVQKRIADGGVQGGNRRGVAVKLCALVDFLGPLPMNLVENHPQREELFTPEGQVLRPTTPTTPGGGQILEAIEPSAASPQPAASGAAIPRPRLVVEALEGAEGGSDMLEFLGQLLNADPEQRPSAQEATAHHFLRFAHTKAAAPEAAAPKAGLRFEGEGATEGPSHAVIDDSHGDGENKIVRKGTGFVHMGELPGSSDEEDEEEFVAGKRASSKDQHAKIEDSHGDGESKICRKGTGFVHVGELPASDSEEEEPYGSARAGSKGKHIEIQDSHGDGENKICRKGTGFVHVGELPPSDSEDEAEQAASHVNIQDAPGTHEESKICRKGTGFVHVGELPASDSEEEEDEATRSVSKDKHAKVEDSHGDGESKICRKGTGFVHMGELPGSSDEEEEEVVHAKIQDSHGDATGENKICRKGTGFVHGGELPLSSDEEEEEEIPMVRVPSKVTKVLDSHGDGENKIVRKGTGFVHMGELPGSSDEEDDDPKERSHANIQEPAKDHVENTICRKGTGFVHVGELPPSDSEEEKEDDAHHVQVSAGPGGETNTICRKGTGFVHSGELPLSSDEEEEPAGITFGQTKSQKEKADRAAKIIDSHGDNENKIARKGTGFVHIGELPPSDSEEEEPMEKNPSSNKAAATIQDTHGDNENKICRKGTGFVHVGELPPSDDEEEEEAPAHVLIKDTHGDNESHICRKGTGFVHTGELPVSSDEEEEDKHAKIDASQADGGSKICRKGTGFVHAGELPGSDDEEEEPSHHVQIQGDVAVPKETSSIVRKGTGFVHEGELPLSSDEEEEEEQGSGKSAKFGKQPSTKDQHAQIQDVSGHVENKIARKGTGFVHMGELPASSDEEEEDEPKVGKKAGQHCEIQDAHGDNESKLARKGTGFVHSSELPLSDDEEDEEPAHIGFSDGEKQGVGTEEKSKVCRAGTGFVRSEDLDFEDEELKVNFDVEPASEKGASVSAKPARKGTGFVSASELPDSDDDEDDD